MNTGGTIIYPLPSDKVNGAKIWEGNTVWNGLKVHIRFTTDNAVTKTAKDRESH